MRALILLAAGMGERAQCGAPTPVGGDVYTATKHLQQDPRIIPHKACTHNLVLNRGQG